MLTSEEVILIINEEIKGNFNISNLHGVDLKKCLINPIRQKYVSSLDENIELELWTVFEETEGGKRYKIFYDEGENSFGLGMNGFKHELVYLGYYGTFLETLNSM